MARNPQDVDPHDVPRDVHALDPAGQPQGSHSPPGRDAEESFTLAIDLGTGGPKVGLVSMTGRLAWHAFATVPTCTTTDGGATQDANTWWEAITELTRQAIACGVVPLDAVEAISVTGQYASTVPVDGSGEPVGDVLLWRDTRGGPIARKRFGGRAAGYDLRTVATWVRRTGGAPALSGADPIGQRLYLAEHSPDVVANARWMLEPIDQITMRFTGVAAASPASMAIAWLIDTRHGAASDYDRDLIRRSGVNAAQLPPLGPINRFVGVVLPSVARRLGLPEGISVTAALPDLHTAALGAGVVAEGQAHLALSTSSWISAPVRARKTDITHQISTIPGLRSDDYLIIDNHEVGASALDWFRTNVLANGDPMPSFDEVTALAATAPPGCGNVLFTPWLAGERSPVEDSRARGGFHNLSLTSGRAEMARAVLEGVAHNSRWLHDAVEKFASRRLDPIRIIGGGAQSDLWCQIHADIMNRTIERPDEPMFANLRGAGLAAGIAARRIAWDDVARLVPVATRFTPRPTDRATHDRLHAQFIRRHRADKSMFRALNTST